ncbi:hypothetical protein [Leuconostoc gasicomitatum]|uniref:hypothetical protein n=1 Tax=Leuconostoc gasicomitatum TaxID=115778 RepID=UPI0007DEA830|nr:hypothetical protein [Leuconostoc gasicomitatum]CUW05237.1 FIG00772976: hypothetical protein [Leuconostoc gasicomitatum]
MADNDYKRPKFQKSTHNIRNFFILMAGIVIIGLGVFIYIGYSSSPKTSEPISQSTANSSTINETIDSNVKESGDESSTSHATDSSQSSSSFSSSSPDKDSAHLKGKSIKEAINWAKSHGRYYSWSITSGGDNAVVTSVTDDGHNISFIASEK